MTTAERDRRELTPWVVVAGGVHYGGGMERANAALVSYLARCKGLVHVVAHAVDPSIRRESGVRIHAVPCPAGSNALGESLLDHRGRVVARHVLARWPQARVIVNGGNCRWPDVNWVHYVHHAWSSCDEGAPAWFKLKNRWMKDRDRRREHDALRAARIILVNSERTRRDVLQYCGSDPGKIHTVYLGTEPDSRPSSEEDKRLARAELGLRADRPLVVFVGGFGHDQRKGFDTLWTAWTQLCADATWDADLIAAGSGAALGRWKAKVVRAGLADRVRLIGFTHQIDRLLQAADLLVSPVRYEAYGLNVHEAICRGVPALVSGGAGIAERYPAELADMILNSPENASELAERLQHWRERRDEWRRCFAPFGARLRECTWLDMADRLVSIVDGTASRSSLGATSRLAAATRL